MNFCPGCGRCRECGQPAPQPPVWPRSVVWPQPVVTVPWPLPCWSSPYYVGDPIPGATETLTVTC